VAPCGDSFYVALWASLAPFSFPASSVDGPFCSSLTCECLDPVARDWLRLVFTHLFLFFLWRSRSEIDSLFPPASPPLVPFSRILERSEEPTGVLFLSPGVEPNPLSFEFWSGAADCRLVGLLVSGRGPSLAARFATGARAVRVMCDCRICLCLLGQQGAPFLSARRARAPFDPTRPAFGRLRSKLGLCHLRGSLDSSATNPLPPQRCLRLLPLGSF